jgi:NAD(P)-dependent dehydrogenase (short-subunit alcohol dehydrogenase family)
MKKLEGNAALVTSAARGIAAAIAERLALDDEAVVVNDAKSARVSMLSIFGFPSDYSV